MQPPDDLERLDPVLRRILDPTPGVAERIARRALATAPPVRRWRPAVAAALAGAAAAIALLLIGPRLGPRPAAPEESEISITNVGDLITVQDRSGHISIVQIGEGTEETAPGGKIFISMGETQ
ncbi:MAG TPA: hypothetical protein VHN15_08615 [Thermoanaerobaculia bacterium]|nr:hypothetical protein [Thermoanaerobaculia bacterium]